MMDPRLKRLKELVEQRAVLHGEFTLSSGAKSDYYFDGRRVTHDAEGITIIGEIVEELLHEAGVEAIGGPSAGANAMITAVQLVSQRRNRAIDGFFVRSEAKKYGTGRQLEGNLPTSPGARVAIVDDTITTGDSIQRAIEAVEAAGCTVAIVVGVVNRRQGGTEALRDRGYDVETLLEADGDKVLLPE